MNSDSKNIKCECGGLTFSVLYNHKDARIDMYCTECNELAHTRSVLWSPLENIQGDIINLLKMVYDLDTKGMITFVIENLGVPKVTQCTDMKLLEKAFYILYNSSEYSSKELTK